MKFPDSLSLPALHDLPEVFQKILQGKEFLRQLIIQLKKDFSASGIPLKIKLNHPYTFADLSKEILDILEKIEIQQVFNLLYRVDINETQLENEMKSPGIDLRIISDLIIKRELQKVVIRIHYSAKGV
jgi:hypothetical protein